jgi:hypothetical protein
VQKLLSVQTRKAMTLNNKIVLRKISKSYNDDDDDDDDDDNKC